MKGAEIDILEFLASVGLSHLHGTFAAEDIDMSVLPQLDKDDFKELGLTIGQRKKIATALNALTETGVATRQEIEVPVQMRRLSVMFCDMIGSTELGERLSIDEMQVLLQHYYEAAHDVAFEFGGHVYGTQGDGVILLFGYPTVLDGFAERCVMAAKSLQYQMSNAAIQLDGHDPINISTRIGIATGQAAVGQGDQALIGETHQLVGPVVNRAARFQTAARPMSIAVDQKTKELTKNQVRFSAAEYHDLKGLPKNTAVFHVLAEQTSVPVDDKPVAMIGRHDELEALLGALATVQSGMVQAVAIKGEAGIGKSTLAEAFLACKETRSARILRLNATSIGAMSPLRPIKSLLETTARHIDAAVLAQALDISEDKLPVAAGLLGLNTDGLGSGSVSPSDRALIIAALAKWIIGDSQTTSILVVENAQWLDDTSRQLVKQSFEAAGQAKGRMMFLEIGRGESIFDEDTIDVQLDLTPLSDQDADKLLFRATNGRSLPQTIRQNILRHSEGNPLMLESLGHAQTHISIGKLDDNIQVPHTIYESVSRRLEHIRSGRSAAEALAVLDSPSKSDVLANVLNSDINRVQRTVDELIEAGLVKVQDQNGIRHVSIRHQVYRDVIYEQLTGQSRQKLHASAYSTLLEKEPEVVSQHPEVLAMHANAARIWEATSTYAANAGEALLKRNALIESEHFLEMAEKALKRLPFDSANNNQRLRVTTAQASVERSRFGISTERSALLGQRAVDLARALGDSKTELLALNGLYAHALVGADYPLAQEYAQSLLETAQRSQDKTFVMIGTRAIGAVAFHRGEFSKAIKNLTVAFDQYDKKQHLPLTHAHGYDHAEICSAFLSMSYWMIGDLAQSHGFGAFSMEHSRKIGHAHSLAQAIAFQVMLGALARDSSELDAIGAEAAELAERFDIRVMGAAAKFFPYVTKLCVRPEQPRAADLQKLQTLYDEFVAVNPFNYGPLVSTLIAQAQLRAGQIDAAKSTLEKGAATETITGETWTASELMRVNANVLHAKGRNKPAHKLLQEAFVSADQIGAKTIALRIACDMAELHPCPEATQKVQDALSSMTSADMGWDIQRAHSILQAERRA